MVGAHGWPRRPPLRPIRFHPAGAACRGEAAPRPYFLVAYPHVIDGLGWYAVGGRFAGRWAVGLHVVRRPVRTSPPTIYIPPTGRADHEHHQHR
jgi:hypothetical protein